MKTNLLKSILALAIFGPFALSAVAEESAPAPLLTEGKSWLVGCINYNYEEPRIEHVTLSRIEVGGDTIVGEKSCKKLYAYPVNREHRKSVLVAYEEEGRVYGSISYTPSQTVFYPMMDMSLTKVGDKAQLYVESYETTDYYEVAAVNQRASNDKEYRELVMTSSGNIVNCWVEGVGAARDNWLTLFPSPASTSGVAGEYMIACYQGDECIFTHNNFSISGAPRLRMPEILTDGKSWIYEQKYINYIDHSRFTRRFKLEVVGDTVAGNVLCKKLRNTCLNDDDVTPSNYCVYEFDRTVYQVDYEGACINPLMRFGHNAGETIPHGMTGGHYSEDSGLLVKEVNKLNVHGVERTEYVISLREQPDRIVNSWVEGIGAATDFWMTMWPELDCIIQPLGNACLLECWQGDECIFTSEDFTHPVAGIEEVSAQPAATGGAVYDLQGRRLAKPLPGQLYIRDGHVRRN